MTQPHQDTETATRVRDALVDALVKLGIDAELIHDQAHLQDDLELDSTETVQVALELTRELGTRIKVDGMHEATVAQVVGIVIDQLRAVETP